MLMNKIGKFLLKKFPLSKQAIWDYSGWLFWRGASKTKKVVISLDVNKAAIDECIKNNCKLIVAHHPHIFSSFKSHIKNPYLRDLYRIMKQNGINVLSLHSNYDNSPIGMSKIISEKIPYNTKCVPPQIFMKTTEQIEEFAINLKKSLNLKNIKVHKNNDIREIKACIIPGGAGSEIQDLNQEEINTLVTGDFKWNQLQTAKDLKINLIDISHGIEKVFVDHISQILTTQFPHLLIIKSFINTEGDVY